MIDERMALEIVEQALIDNGRRWSAQLGRPERYIASCPIEALVEQIVYRLGAAWAFRKEEAECSDHSVL